MRVAVAVMMATFVIVGRGESQTGRQIFEGKGNCHVCHAKTGKGTPLGPDLTDGEWIHIDGSLPAIAGLVRSGVAKPARYPAPMLPMGGAKLTKEEIDAVATYVKELGKPRG